jgi:hypothetical protein
LRAVPQSEGVYMATGHSVWGIFNAPATGEALAELIAEGVSSITDLTPFDLARLRSLDSISTPLRLTNLGLAPILMSSSPAPARDDSGFSLSPNLDLAL